MPKPLTVWITANCGKYLKRWEYQTTWPASWEICRKVKKQQLELDMEQQTCSKSGKKYIKAVYCHPAYLTYMQSTSWETLGWRKHKPESNCQHLLDHQKSKRVPEKHLFLVYRLCQSLWLCGSQETVENSERDGNTRLPDLPLEKPVCRSGSNS